MPKTFNFLLQKEPPFLRHVSPNVRIFQTLAFLEGNLNSIRKFSVHLFLLLCYFFNIILLNQNLFL